MGSLGDGRSQQSLSCKESL